MIATVSGYCVLASCMGELAVDQCYSGLQPTFNPSPSHTTLTPHLEAAKQVDEPGMKGQSLLQSNLDNLALADEESVQEAKHRKLGSFFEILFLR